MSFAGELDSGADLRVTEEVLQEELQRYRLTLPTPTQMVFCLKEKEQMATATTAPLPEQSKNSEY